jgi:hypothetical protein
MDAKPAPSLGTLALVALCIAVAAAGSVWQIWDTFGARQRSLLQGWDDAFYYMWLPSVVLDHDVDFANQIVQCDAFDAATRQEALTQPRTATGRLPNKYPPGWALGSLPFFLAAHAVAPAGSTGFEPVYLVTVWCGQLGFAAVGLWLAVQIVGRFFPRPVAVGAVLAVWLASPLVYYQTARLTMSHSQVFALAMAAFWLALRIADGAGRDRDWVLLGLAGALLVVTRNAAAVYLVLPALVVGEKLRTVRAGAGLVLGAALPLAAQLAAWKVLYGSWFVYTYGGERFDFAHLHLGAILFSPRHGWFYWHPLLLGGIAAFLGWAVRHAAGRAWLVSLALITLLNAAWPTWWLGSSFGHRGFEAATLCAMLGVAALSQAVASRPPARRLVRAAIGAAVAWNLLLLALFLAQRIPREDAVTYQDAATAAGNWLAGR